MDRTPDTTRDTGRRRARTVTAAVGLSAVAIAGATSVGVFVPGSLDASASTTGDTSSSQSGTSADSGTSTDQGSTDSGSTDQGSTDSGSSGAVTTPVQPSTGQGSQARSSGS
ncbi:hypothetical protein ABID81_002453 [Frigoribacterium sp. PvP054]|uniref:hypothetical protein n=1 Tax=Frigoribacterium sp. PvP054 TaxID=3156438 RepID=UPI0033951704